MRKPSRHAGTRRKRLFTVIIITSFLVPIAASLAFSSVDSGAILDTLGGNQLVNTSPETSAIADMLADEADGYTFGSTVEYNVDYRWDFSATHYNQKEFWFPRINNHSARTFPGMPNIQESYLLDNRSNYNDFAFPDYQFDPQDDYNNTYDYYSARLGGATENFQFNATYNTTIRAINWDIDKSTIGEYDTSSPIYRNYTGAENMLEADDPVLIALSNSICAGKDSVVDNASAIYKWLANEENMQYEVQTTELSAREAYDQGKGDCSEFSNLMVTLLRIQGIPARKVLGLLIVEQTEDGWKQINSPSIGESWEYSVVYDGSTATFNMPGHAWIEYYVPGYGWIQCDPTNDNYFNRNDFTHLYVTVGENFGGGIDPSLPSPETELCLLPDYNSPGSEQFTLTIEITVTDVNMVYDNNLWIFIAIFVVVSLLIIVISVVMKNRKSKMDY